MRNHSNTALGCVHVDARLDGRGHSRARAVQKSARQRSGAVAKDLVLERVQDAATPLQGAAPDKRAVGVLV